MRCQSCVLTQHTSRVSSAFIHLSIFVTLLMLTGCGGGGSSNGDGENIEPNGQENITPPINGGDVSIIGLFNDANLQACIETEAAKQSLTDARADQLTSIVRCPSESISDLNGINNLVNITGLALSNNQITDISPLQYMTNLSILSIQWNNISDISVFSTIPDLSILYLGNNNISDISVFSEMTSLTILDLSSNNVSDVSVLSTHTGMGGLWLENNNIVDVAPLVSLTNLTELRLWNNNIGGMGVGNAIDLVALTKLSSLYIQSNPEMSCTGLGTLITTFTGITVLNPATATNGTNCTSP